MTFKVKLYTGLHARQDTYCSQVSFLYKPILVLNFQRILICCNKWSKPSTAKSKWQISALQQKNQINLLPSFFKPNCIDLHVKSRIKFVEWWHLLPKLTVIVYEHWPETGEFVTQTIELWNMWITLSCYYNRV